MNKSIKIIGTIVVGIIIIYVFLSLVEKNAPITVNSGNNATSTTPTPTSLNASPTPSTTSGYLTYTDPSGDYSVSYPSNFTSSTSSTNELFNKGVSFLFPASFSDKTNLGKDSRVYIIKNATAKNCTADEFINDSYYNGSPTKPTVVTINGKSYSSLMTNDAGAGNIYETIIYTNPGTKPCYGVELFLHSSNIGNYTAGTVKQFDRDQLLSIFETMLATFKLKK